MIRMKTLIINLGGTSTKVALFENNLPIIKETIRHDVDEIKKCKQIWEQYSLRKESILKFCAEQNIGLTDISLFVSRGPVVKPLMGGVYAIDDQMVTDAKNQTYGKHVCSLGCAIAWELAEGVSGKALIADPPCTDEMIPIARYTGLPQIKRRSFFQALSHKALGRQLGEKLGKPYEELSLVIVHLGSGISVATHHNGLVIDITNGLGGDAPFGMDRTGTLPASDWKKLIQSGEFSDEEIEYMLNGGGGLMAHLGTNDGMAVENMVKAGDAKALEVMEAMAFQVSKAIGSAAAAMGKKPDGIAITGGLAYFKLFIDFITSKVDWIADVHIMPDVDEIEALAFQTIKAFNGEIEIKKY